MSKSYNFLTKNKVLLVLGVLLNISVLRAQDVLSAANLIIETERLLLRLIDVTDAQDIFEFTSDPEVEKLTGMFVLHHDCVETQLFIQRWLDAYSQRGFIPWAVVYKPHNKVIGIFSLFSYSTQHSKAEIGYSFSRSYWGQGIATEVTRAVINFGFNVLGLHRIQATFDPRNGASGRVLEKSGFKYEGLMRDYYLLRDEFCDRVLCSILNSEFKKLYSL